MDLKDKMEQTIETLRFGTLLMALEQDPSSRAGYAVIQDDLLDSLEKSFVDLCNVSENKEDSKD